MDNACCDRKMGTLSRVIISTPPSSLTSSREQIGSTLPRRYVQSVHLARVCRLCYFNGVFLQIFVGEILLYEKFREEILDTALFRRNIIEILFRKKFKKYVYFVG